MRAFGEIVKAQRQKLGLTQKQIADSIGVSDAYICSLENAKKPPPPYYTVAAIAHALQLDVERLWEVAAKHRGKRAAERSQRRTVNRSRDRGDQQDSVIGVPDSQINAFFDRPEIQMTTFGLFQKQPKEMTMEEKRAVYQAINSAREVILGRTNETNGSV